MENQHREITGYRELSESEIAAMNEVKQKGNELGELVEKLRTNNEFDQRWVSIGLTNLQHGIMDLVRAIAKPASFVFALLLMAGCSSGLQETAFRDESGTYIVSRSLVNDRVTANQPHVSGVFACDTKVTSEQMVDIKKDGAEHSWYTQCQPIEQYRPGAYHATSDQPIATLYKGPVEAAILGAAVGTGLAMSGDTITQRGSSTAVAGASAQGGNAINKGHRRR
jgi:hypothetical protein